MKFELEITRECNFSCKGCDRLCDLTNKDSFSRISLDEIKNIVNEINSFNDVIEHLVVIGGEPTIHPDCYEICDYLKKNLKNCRYFALATNHSNNEIIEKVRKLKFGIRKDDNSEDIKEIYKNKLKKHNNILLSPKEKNLKLMRPHKCWLLLNCGISIHKYKGKIKYCFCGAGSSICKLVEREDLMKNSLKELLESNKEEYYENICKNCMYLAEKPIKVKDSDGEISECFKNGYNKLKEYYDT